MKQKQRNRLLALLLSVCMMITMLPESVSAFSDMDQLPSEIGQPNGPVWNAGDGLLAQQYMSSDPSTGGIIFSLVIYKDPQAEGAAYTMSDFTDPTEAPWNINAHLYENLYIQDGTTSIGDHAFEGFNNLQTAEIPDSVTSIGDSAFRSCSKAVFQDGSNTDLDLSNVASLGEYAFSGCSELTGVVLNDGLGKIPDYAFNGTGLTSLTIPEGITEIGNSAFSSCGKLDEVVLPDSITTIGDYAFSGAPLKSMQTLTLPAELESVGDRAFYRNTDSPNTSITSMVIGEKVTSIGDHAFYNFQGLKEVDVYAAGLETVGASAFGDGEHNAYHDGLIEVDGLYYQSGTEFQIQIEDHDTAQAVADKFQNGVNCYTGEVKSLIRDYDNDVPATCTTGGIEAFIFTSQAGSSMGLQRPTAPLGHELNHKDLGNPLTEHHATCERNAYTDDFCTRCDYRTQAVEIPNTQLHHHYVLSGSITNPTIAADNPGDTVITYVCENGQWHTTESTRRISAILKPQTLTLKTTETLAKLNLPSTPSGTDTLTGNLELDETKVDMNATYDVGVQIFPVYFDPTPSTFDNVEGLYVTVQIVRDTLSFYNTTFRAWERVIENGFDEDNPEFGVNQVPAAARIVETQFRSKIAGSDWTTTAPDDTVEGEYEVRVIFSYDASDYTVDTRTQEGYSIEVDPDAQRVYLTHDYVVRERSMENVSVQVKPSPTYDGTPHELLEVSGMLRDSTITFIWTENGQEQRQTVQSGNSAVVEGPSITAAGSYEVQIEISKESYETERRTASVEILKRPIALPEVTRRILTYYQGYTQTGVKVDHQSEFYEFVSGDESAINAGSYAVTVKLRDSANNCWDEAALNKLLQEGAEYGVRPEIHAQDESLLTISWRIDKKAVVMPKLQDTSGKYSWEYTGASQMYIDNPSNTPSWLGHKDVQYTFIPGETETSGDTLVATYTTNRTGVQLSEEIFRITDAQATDVGHYKPVATLTNPNYYWSENAQSDQYALKEWDITAYLILDLPVFTPSNAAYTGVDYSADNIQFDTQSKGYAWIENGVLTLDADTPWLFYPNQSSGASASDAISVGNYYAFPNFVYDAQNYKLSDEYRFELYSERFQITPAKLTFAPMQDVTLTYHETPYTIPTPEYVSGLVNGEGTDQFSFRYSYEFTPAGADEVDETQSVTAQTTPPVISALGTYKVTISIVSDNYSADAIQFQITINRYEGDNTIKLETSDGQPVEHQQVIQKVLGDAPFQIRGIAQFDPEHAAITYTPQNAQIATVDGTGLVTILAPGTTLIKVDSAATDKIGAGHTEYTVVVDKYQPVLQLDAKDYSGLYFDGSPLEPADYDHAKFAGLTGVEPTADLQYRFYAEADADDAQNGTSNTVTPEAAGKYWLRVDYPGDDHYKAASAAPILIEIQPADFAVEVVGYGTGSYGTAAGQDFARYDGASHLIAQLTIAGQAWDPAQPGAYVVSFAEKTGEDSPDPAVDANWQVADTVLNTTDSGEYWCRVVDTTGNYAPQVRAFSVNLRPQPLEVTFAGLVEQRDYAAGQVDAGSGSAVVSGNPAQEQITVSASAAYADPHAGTDKAITISYTFDFADGVLPENYSFDGIGFTGDLEVRTAGATGTILPKAITVTGIQAVDRQYSGQAGLTVALGIAPEGLQAAGFDPADADRFTLALAPDAQGRIADANVGEKTVFIGADDTMDAADLQDLILLTDKEGYPGDYVVTGINALRVEILPREIGFTAPDDTSASYTGKPVAASYYQAAAIDDAIGADEIGLEELQYQFYHAKDDAIDWQSPLAAGEIPDSVGTYFVVVTVPDSAANFTEAADQNLWRVVIGKAKLSAQIDDITVTYRGADQVLAGEDGILDIAVTSSTTEPPTPWTSYVASFIAKGDYTSAQDVPEAVWSSQAVTSVRNVEDSGTYLYRIEDPQNGNHEPAYGAFQVTVEPAKLSVQGTINSVKTYDGTELVTGDCTAAYTLADGVAAGDDITGITLAARYRDSAAAAQDKPIDLEFQIQFRDALAQQNYTFSGDAAVNDTPATDAAASEGAEVLTITAATTGQIQFRELAIAVEDHTMVYSGGTRIPLDAAKLSILDADTSVVAGEQLTLSADAAGTVASANVSDGRQEMAVSTDAIVLQGDTASNYRVASVQTCYATITPRQLGLELNAAMQSPYTGQAPQRTSYQASVTSVVGQELTERNVVYTFYTDETKQTAVTPVRVGRYYLAAALNLDPDAPDYDANYLGASAEGWFQITEDASQTLTPIVTAYDSPYDGTAHSAVTIQIPNPREDPQNPDDDYLQPGTDYLIYFWTDGGAEQTEMPQVQDVTEQSWNYRIDLFDYPDPAAGTFTAKVTPRPLTITPDMASVQKVYDGGTDVDASQVNEILLSGNDASGEQIVIAGFEASYDNPNATVQTQGAQAIHFVYTLDFGGADASNYSYGGQRLTAGTTELTGSIAAAIVPKPIQVRILDQTQTYDGEDWSARVGQTQDQHWAVPAGAIESQNGQPDTLDLVLSIPAGATDVDTYQIQGVCGNQNYAAAFTGQNGQTQWGSFVVSRRPITVQIGNDTGIYGEPYTPALTLLPSDALVGADAWTDSDLSGIVLQVSPSTVGAYPITAADGDYGNYTIDFLDGSYEVQQRPITIRVEDHESSYGGAVDGGILTPVEGKDYTVISTYQIVPGDDLGLQLSTEASEAKPVGLYPISAQITQAQTAKNYEITFAGGSWSGDAQYGTYHIERAALSIAFQTQGEIPISYQDTFTNPLRFTNVSAGAAVSDAEAAKMQADGKVHYASSDPTVATVSADGTVSIHNSPASVTISAWVEQSDNFEPAEAVSYTLHISTSSGIRVDFSQQTLTYTGDPQPLLSAPTVSPANAELVYWLEGGTPSTDIPTGEQAQSYVVYYRATAENYDPYENHITVTIAQASPSTGFEPDSDRVSYQNDLIYDLTQHAELPIGKNYQGSIKYVSENSSVAEIVGNDPSRILIKQQGDVRITAMFDGDANYTPGNYTFTLHVVDSATMIECSAPASYTVTYDGSAYGLRLDPADVSGPNQYELYFSDDEGLSYDLTELNAPHFTDAGEYTIYYQIRANGYLAANFEQTVNIDPKQIDAEMFKDSVAPLYTYIGAAIQPPVSVSYQGMALTEGVDYEVDYRDNVEVGTGYVIVSAAPNAVNYVGTAEVPFRIAARSANYLTASLSPTYGFYGTDSATSTVQVQFGGSNEPLVPGVDYTLSCSDPDLAASVEIDGNVLTFSSADAYGTTYPITVTARGNYSGTVHLSYTLLPASSSGGLELTVDGAATPLVSIYGEPVEGAITVANPNGGEDLTEGEDYDLTYTYFNSANEQVTPDGERYTPEVLGEAGIYVVTATAKNGYDGSGTFVFLIQKRDLSDPAVDVSVSNEVYTGEPIVPDCTIDYPGLLESDYEVTFLNNLNAGRAEAIFTATAESNNFTGSVRSPFTIAPKEFTDAFTVDPIASQAYTGLAITPELTVRDETGKALASSDYEVFYAQNIDIGTALVRVEGRNNYEGMITDITFEIIGTAHSFLLQLERTEWTYDPTDTASVGQISVTYDGQALTLGTDYTLSVQREDTVLVDRGTDIAAVLAAIQAPGKYLVTAAGIGSYPNLQNAQQVRIDKIQPTLALSAAPETLTGGGAVQLKLTAQNLPEGVVLTELNGIKNGAKLEPLQLVYADGVYTAELQANNENATYVFTVTVEETDYYAAASTSVTVLTARRSGGGAGGGGGSADPKPEVYTHSAYLLGYDDGTFRPDGNMTRAQAAAIFARLLVEDIPTDLHGPFTDVPDQAWYAQSVNSLQQYGILTGRSETVFDPDAPITRAEFVTICTRFDTYAAVDTVNDFTDVSVGHWAYAYINYAVHEKWINGYSDNTFRPDALITRAEAVQVVNRVLARRADTDYIDQHTHTLNEYSDLPSTYWAYYEILEASLEHKYTLAENQEQWQ